SVRISNYSAEKLTLQLYPHDAINTPQGGFDLLARDELPQAVGSWVRLAKGTVTIAPRSRVDVPFRLDIPGSATPGDHAGGIVAARTDPGGSQGQKVEHRVGTRIYLRVSGTLKTSAEITDVSAQYRERLNPAAPGETRVIFDVHNTGNTRLSGSPRVVTVNSLGRKMTTTDTARVSDLLPGERISIELSQSGSWPTGWLNIRPQFETPGQTFDASSTKVWAIPWGLIVSVLCSLAAVQILVTRRRKKGRT
ncbi:MAG: WxL protein peptidoglycan domain-containing protein, partial [Angustibacter sp.]